MIAALALLALGLVAAAGVANALRPPRAWWLWFLGWVAAWITVELAAHLIVLSGLAAALLIWLGALEHTAGVIGLALLAVADAVGALHVWHASRTRVFARGIVAELDPEPEAPRFPRSHVVFPFLMFRRRGVRHERGVVYARRGSFPLKLDVYAPEAPAERPRPAIVEVHGGGWVSGTRKEQGIPLLNHLAANGWVGFNVSYRLSPLATWPDHAVDVKQAIAWVREHAEELGVDPSFVAITGGSAGGHICAFCALTSGDRSLQPGFEHADTSVAAAVPFYGVYDFLDPDVIHHRLLHWVLERYVFKALIADEPERFRAASPLHLVHTDAPPFLIVHGERDSLVPAEDARRFAAALREVSRNPVVYAEMRGGEHAFDLIPSPRTAPVIEAIERFLHTLRSRSLEGGRRPAPATVAELEDAIT
jgi:acetyl esterase/lipase